MHIIFFIFLLFLFSYEKFNEQIDGSIRSHRKKDEQIEKYINYKTETDDQQISNLEKWHKNTQKKNSPKTNQTISFEKKKTENKELKNKLLVPKNIDKTMLNNTPAKIPENQKYQIITKQTVETFDKDLSKEPKFQTFNETPMERKISQISETSLRKRTVEDSEINSRNDSQHSNNKGKIINGDKNQSNVKQDLDSYQLMNRKENIKKYIGEKSDLDREEKLNTPSEFDIIIRRNSYQSNKRDEKVASINRLEFADKKEEKDNNKLNLPEIQAIQNSELDLGVQSYTDRDFSNGLKLPAIIHQSGLRRKISVFQEKFMAEEPDSLEEFKNQIELVFTESFEHDSFVQKGNFHQKLVDSILVKVDCKIRDNESTILQKQRQLQ